MHRVALQVRQLPIGAEIAGIDLRERVGDDSREQLRALLDQYAMLLFRDQQLTPEHQLATGELFGTTSKLGTFYESTADGVRYISNVAEDGIQGHGELSFHTDQSYLPNPCRLVMLYGVQVTPPGCGGQTLFANMRDSYARLPADLQHRIEGLQALHLFDSRVAAGRAKSVDRYRDQEVPPHEARAIHPLVLTHPVTGAKSLYISRRHVDYIFGLPPAESEALLDELKTYLYHPDRIYAHEWAVGDLIIWDNLTLQHGRAPFDSSHPRHLRRTQLT